MASSESIKTRLADQQKNAFLGFKLWEEETVHNKVLGHLAKIQDLRPRRVLPCQRGGSPGPMCTFLLTPVPSPALKSSKGAIFFLGSSRNDAEHTTWELGRSSVQKGPPLWHAETKVPARLTRFSPPPRGHTLTTDNKKSQGKKSHPLWLSSYTQTQAPNPGTTSCLLIINFIMHI